MADKNSTEIQAESSTHIGDCYQELPRRKEDLVHTVRYLSGGPAFVNSTISWDMRRIVHNIACWRNALFVEACLDSFVEACLDSGNQRCVRGELKHKNATMVIIIVLSRQHWTLLFVGESPRVSSVCQLNTEPAEAAYSWGTAAAGAGSW